MAFTLQKIAGEADDDESTVVTNGFDEIFASAGRVVHSAPSGGGGGSGRDVPHETPSNAITKEQEVEQQCIGGAVKGFFRKVFKG